MLQPEPRAIAAPEAGERRTVQRPQPKREEVMRLAAVAFAAALAASSGGAVAEQVNVTHWGEIMDGLPWAVGIEKGYFKAAGIDITEVIGSKGGGTTIRNIMAGDLPYGEVSPSAAVAAVRSGIDVKIVNSGVRNDSDFNIAVKRPDIKEIKDLAGNKFGITSPKSNTDIIGMMILEKYNIPADKMPRPSLGSTMAGIQALDSDSVQAVIIQEPLWSKLKDKYHSIGIISDVLPPMLQTVGVASVEFIKAHPEKVRAIIEGRRKGVQFIEQHPEEAAATLTKYYEGLDPKIAREATLPLAKAHYWSEGDIEMDALEGTIKGMRLVGELDGPFDAKQLVDQSLLPKDLQR
jgi:NitT/TauT family transport system substrate-binding protein